MRQKTTLVLALLLALFFNQQTAQAQNAGVAAYIQQASSGRLDGQVIANAMSAKTRQGNYQRVYLIAGTKFLWAIVMTPLKKVDGIYDRGFVTQTAVDNAFLFEVNGHQLVLADLHLWGGQKILLGEQQRPGAPGAEPRQTAATATTPRPSSPQPPTEPLPVPTRLANEPIVLVAGDEDAVLAPASTASEQASLASRQAQQRQEASNQGRRNVYVNGGLGLVALGGAAMSQPYVALGAGVLLLGYNFLQGLGNTEGGEDANPEN